MRTVLLTGVAPLAFLASAAAAQTPSDANIVAGAVTVTLNSTPVTASGSFTTGGAAGALALEITATPTLLNWTSAFNLAAGSTISFAKASGGPDFVLTNRLLAGGTNLVNGTITAQGRVQFLTGGSTLSFGTTGVFNGTTLLATTLGATDSNITAGGALTLTGTDSGASLSLRTGTLSNSTNNLPVLSAITNSGAITIDSTTITNSGGSAPGISATSTTGNITVTSGTVTSTSTTLPNASVASEGILAQTGGTIQITSGTVTNSGPTASAIAAIGGAGVQINSTSATTSGGNSTAIFAKSANGNVSVTSGTLTVSGTGGNGIGATADNGTVTIASTTISVAGNDAQAF
ncbi:MAG: hypothetical protein INF91_04705, partial [Alphaproteobacteria bacterium]|nr:hypothetical protein [Alphaproteobacteria bacterium]